MEEEEAKVEERAGDKLAVHYHVLLPQVPPAPGAADHSPGIELGMRCAVAAASTPGALPTGRPASWRERARAHINKNNLPARSDDHRRNAGVEAVRLSSRGKRDRTAHSVAQVDL
jgi:hypothetical protein